MTSTSGGSSGRMKYRFCASFIAGMTTETDGSPYALPSAPTKLTSSTRSGEYDKDDPPPVVSPLPTPAAVPHEESAKCVKGDDSQPVRAMSNVQSWLRPNE